MKPTKETMLRLAKEAGFDVSMGVIRYSSTHIADNNLTIKLIKLAMAEGARIEREALCNLEPVAYFLVDPGTQNIQWGESCLRNIYMDTEEGEGESMPVYAIPLMKPSLTTKKI